LLSIKRKENNFKHNSKDNFKKFKEMKKVMFLMAVAGMFAFAACNNTPAESETIDTAAVVEEMVEEPIVDSAVETMAEEAVAEAATEVAE